MKNKKDATGKKKELHEDCSLFGKIGLDMAVAPSNGLTTTFSRIVNKMRDEQVHLNSIYEEIKELPDEEAKKKLDFYLKRCFTCPFTQICQGHKVTQKLV